MITTSMNKLLNEVSSKDPRNRHLIPEVSLRAKRILEGVVKEETSAFAVNPVDVVLYQRLTNGRICTCKDESIKKDLSNLEQTSISLSDFLVNVPTLLKTKDSCPICFDIGFVGGYNRIGYQTIVFDSTLKYNYSNVMLNKTRPYWFSATNKSGYISWSFVIPKYFSNVADLAIKWKKEPSNWSIEINSQIIDEDIICSNKGQRVTLTLKMKDSSGEAGVYAIFLVLTQAEPYLPSDFPNLTRSLTGDMNIVNEITSPFTVYFNSKSKKLNTTDVFFDMKYSRLWRILEIANTDPMEQIIQFECSCRLVRDFEISYFLPNKYILKYYPIEYTFVI